MTTAVALQNPTVRRNVGVDMPQDTEETGVQIWNAAPRPDTIRLALPVPRSPILEVLLFWLAAAICLVAEAAIIRSALAARAEPGSALVPGSRRALEIFYAVLPALLLGVVLLLTWRAVSAGHAA